MTLNKKDRLRLEKKLVAKKFKSRCYVCWKKFGKYFLFHHLKYIDGEPYYTDYKSSIDYNLALLPFIRKEPKRFMLLCRVHHHFLEWGKKLGDDKFKRFCRARRMSRNGM